MNDKRTIQVGPNIRAIRERRGYSLRALAELCGLSVNAISLIERGENSPTVSSLHALSAALEVPITEFFHDDHDQAVVYVPADGRLSSQANGIRMESLGIGLRYQQLEPFVVTLEPGCGNCDQPVTHAGEELILVLEGQLAYTVDGRTYDLERGASLLFDATLPHCFQNTGSGQTRIVMVFHAGDSAHVARRTHLETRLRGMAGGGTN